MIRTGSGRARHHWKRDDHGLRAFSGRAKVPHPGAREVHGLTDADRDHRAMESCQLLWHSCRSPSRFNQGRMPNSVRRRKMKPSTGHVVSLQHTAPRAIAAVSARMAPSSVPAEFKPHLDQVYAGRSSGLQLDGQNIFVYRHDDARWLVRRTRRGARCGAGVVPGLVSLAGGPAMGGVRALDRRRAAADGNLLSAPAGG